MKARKFLLFLLIAVLLLGGCGKSEKTGNLKAFVLFASDTKGAQQEELLRELEKAGFTAESLSANADHNQQMTQLSQLQQEYDLVIVEPVDVSLAGELAEKLKALEKPGIFIGEEPSAQVLESWDKLFYVGADQAGESFLQGTTLQCSLDRGDINGDGVIAFAILRGPKDDERAKLLTQNCDEALRKGVLETDLVAVQLTDWSEGNARQQTLHMLKQHGKDIEVLLCNSDALALGAVQAVKDGGWIPGQDIYIVGIGGSEEMLQAIRQGECLGTVIPDEHTWAEQVARVAKTVQEGKATEKWFYAGYQTVTKENVTIYDAQ